MAFNGQPAYVEALEGLSCYEQVYFCFNEKTMYYPQHPVGVWNYSPTYFFFELFHHCKLCVTNRSLGSDAPSNNLTGLFPSAEIILF